jgi:hypothetical protein
LNEATSEPVEVMLDVVLVPVNENVAEPVACSTAFAEPVKEPDSEPVETTAPNALAVNEPDSEPVETTAPELEPVNDAEPVAVRTVVAEAHLTEPHFVAPQPDVAGGDVGAEADLTEPHLTEPHFVAPQPDVAISYSSLGEAHHSLRSALAMSRQR